MKSRILKIVALSSLVIFVPVIVNAQGLSTYGERSYLCIKRVGKLADGQNNRGRDAYMNPKPCPKGYYTIDLSTLGAQSTGVQGQKGDKGDKGDVGPQGAAGIGGGSIIGRLVACTPYSVEEENFEPETEAYVEQGEQEIDDTNPCAIPEGKHRGPSRGGYEVYIPGQSSASRPDKECVFRMNNVPTGTYDLAIDQMFLGHIIRKITGVTVNEGAITTLGDIPLCKDKDKDGFDQSLDCNDYNDQVNPDATEVCDDGIDNNCNGSSNEGCAQITPSPTATFVP